MSLSPHNHVTLSTKLIVAAAPFLQISIDYYRSASLHQRTAILASHMHTSNHFWSPKTSVIILFLDDQIDIPQSPRNYTRQINAPIAVDGNKRREKEREKWREKKRDHSSLKNHYYPMCTQREIKREKQGTWCKSRVTLLTREWFHRGIWWFHSVDRAHRDTRWQSAGGVSFRYESS